METADYLRISYGYCRTLVANGTIRSSKTGSGGRSSPRKVRKEWADAYLEARASGGTGRISRAAR